MTVEEDLQEVLIGLSRKEKYAELAKEYIDALAVLAGSAVNKGSYPNVISDLRMALRFEQESNIPDADKIAEISAAIAKLEGH